MIVSKALRLDIMAAIGASRLTLAEVAGKGGRDPAHLKRQVEGKKSISLPALDAIGRATGYRVALVPLPELEPDAGRMKP